MRVFKHYLGISRTFSNKRRVLGIEYLVGSSQCRKIIAGFASIRQQVGLVFHPIRIKTKSTAAIVVESAVGSFVLNCIQSRRKSQYKAENTSFGIFKFNLKQLTSFRGSREQLQSLGFIPQSLVLRSILFGCILIY